MQPSRIESLTVLAAGGIVLPVAKARGERARSTRVSSASVVVGLLIFAAIWLALLAYTSLSPPVDNIEQLTWASSIEWGYYKHPPLPTWLIWLPSRLFGSTALTSYALGATLSLVSMWLMWRLVCSLRGKTHASVALLAALCITYYNGRLHYYNHNIVLMLWSAVGATLCWKAFATRRLRWWVALGLVLGLAALTKYQAAVTMTSVLIFAVHQRAWNDRIHRLGLVLAAMITLLVLTPHVYWLRAHDFGPIHYALDSSLGARFDTATRVFGSLHWLADQVFNRFLPALLLLLLVLGFRDRRGVTPNLPAVPVMRAPGSSAFLMVWGFTPLVFMTLVGISFGADLQLQWGTAFLLFTVPAVMELFANPAWREANLVRTFGIFVVIQGILILLCGVTSPRGPLSLRDHLWHAFDSARLAYTVGGAARAELGGPVRVVSGTTGVAGALALQLPEHPLVLIDGQFDRSPWVSRALVRDCGLLELGPLSKLSEGNAVGPAFPGLAWRVIKPKAGSGCTRGRSAR